MQKRKLHTQLEEDLEQQCREGNVRRKEEMARNLERARSDLEENLRRGIGEGRVRLNRRWRGVRTRRE